MSNMQVIGITGSYGKTSSKNILSDIIGGKTVKELAIDYKCSEMTICRRRKKIFNVVKDLM